MSCQVIVFAIYYGQAGKQKKTYTDIYVETAGTECVNKGNEVYSWKNRFRLHWVIKINAYKIEHEQLDFFSGA